jgi:PTH1 family peptidyl-tRNA hydrolase
VKAIVGLGNPGSQYKGTRHNVGFDVIDEIARRQSVGFESAPAEALIAKWRRPEEAVLLVKPLTFMNLSGQAIGELARYFKIEVADLIVVVDEVHLPLGKLRARKRGSAGGHNGLKSVIGSLGLDAFPRLRIGVGRGDNRRDLAVHVLATFEPDERSVIEDAVVRAADASEAFIADGVADAMNRFNRKDEPDPGNGKPATGNGKSEDN